MFDITTRADIPVVQTVQLNKGLWDLWDLEVEMKGSARVSFAGGLENPV